MKVTILGGGAYGIALSLMFYKNNCDITIFEKIETSAESLKKDRENKKVMPGIIIPEDIKISTNMEESMNDSALIVFAVPTQFVGDIAKELKPYIKKDQHICVASKGIEQNSCHFVEEVIGCHIKTKNIATISGASFAVDMANNAPVGLMLVAKNNKTRDLIMSSLANDTLKLRISKDLIGTQICGAVKNVIAIASGILRGMDMPESTQAMLITESLHDIKALIKALGGKGKTVLSYAGFGDILLTCTSEKSRNFTFGRMIGEKQDKKIIDEYINSTTIEGLYTLKSVRKLLKKKNVNIPVIDLIYDIVFHNENPEKIKEFLITKC